MLKELDLSHFCTKNVKNMDSMFCGCTKLEKLNISNFNTQNVLNMNSMFGQIIKYFPGCPDARKFPGCPENSRPGKNFPENFPGFFPDGKFPGNK